MQDKLKPRDIVEFIDSDLDKKYGPCVVMSEPWKCGEFELVKLANANENILSVKPYPGGFRTDYLKRR